MPGPLLAVFAGNGGPGPARLSSLPFTALA